MVIQKLSGGHGFPILNVKAGHKENLNFALENVFPEYNEKRMPS